MNKINYEPKMRIRFQEVKEVDVNMTFDEVIKAMNPINVVDCLRILKKQYHIAYKGLAEVMGVSPSAIRTGILYGTFDGVLRPEKVEDGILNIQHHYLRGTFETDVEEVDC